MSATTMKRADESAKLQRQVTQAKTVLRELRETLEDMEDRLELDRAIKRNKGKPGIPWEQAKKELGLDDL
ncbi:MAG: hypothetical protein HY300_16015 [Verrucomicrobia bacterium]|nr:hypothetical protein [Verrucomicrobiota bacterium]